MIKNWKMFNESKSDIKVIEDIFLELKDDGWKVKHESFEVNSDYPFTEEFFIWKKGNSGYYLDGGECGLFNTNEIIDYILRFCDICDTNSDKYRIITSDGQYTLDITKKINNLESVDKSDVLETTHLHLKKSSGKADIIDLDNVKFVSCQILK